MKRSTGTWTLYVGLGLMAGLLLAWMGCGPKKGSTPTSQSGEAKGPTTAGGETGTPPAARTEGPARTSTPPPPPPPAAPRTKGAMSTPPAAPRSKKPVATTTPPPPPHPCKSVDDCPASQCRLLKLTCVDIKRSCRVEPKVMGCAKRGRVGPPAALCSKDRKTRHICMSMEGLLLPKGLSCKPRERRLYSKALRRACPAKRRRR